MFNTLHGRSTLHVNPPMCELHTHTQIRIHTSPIHSTHVELDFQPFGASGIAPQDRLARLFSGGTNNQGFAVFQRKALIMNILILKTHVPG